MHYEVNGVDIRAIQNVQLEILKEFDRVCQLHNIKYQLMAGTLLGAVRHKGFIPWDDDIDVCMLREDYSKFVNLYSKELKSDYFLQSHETDKEYYMQFSKIRKNGTLFVEKLTSDLTIHHGIYIDVFPLDNIMPSTAKGKLHQKLTYFLGRMNLLRSKTVSLNTNKPWLKFFRLSAHYTMKLIPKKWTDNILENVITLFQEREVEYVTHLTNGASKDRYQKYKMKKSDFSDVVDIMFEGEKFPAPNDAHEVLSNLFGDYMKLPPEDQREPHHGVIKIKL